MTKIRVSLLSEKHLISHILALTQNSWQHGNKSDTSAMWWDSREFVYSQNTLNTRNWGWRCSRTMWVATKMSLDNILITNLSSPICISDMLAGNQIQLKYWYGGAIFKLFMHGLDSSNKSTKK